MNTHKASSPLHELLGLQRQGQLVHAAWAGGQRPGCHAAGAAEAQPACAGVLRLLPRGRPAQPASGRRDPLLQLLQQRAAHGRERRALLPAAAAGASCAGRLRSCAGPCRPREWSPKSPRARLRATPQPAQASYPLTPGELHISCPKHATVDWASQPLVLQFKQSGVMCGRLLHLEG